MTPELIPTRIELLRLLPPGTVGVEIGVCRGEFSAEILANAPDLKHLHLVDAWRHLGGDYEHDPENVDDGGHEMRERLVRARFANEPRVSIHRAMSADFINAAEHGLFQWAYIDAGHDFNSVIKDLLACSCAGVRYILGHDYRTDAETIKMRFGVVEAVTKFSHVMPYRLRYLTTDEWPSYWLEKL